MSLESRRNSIIQERNLRDHLIMMLTALGYVGNVTKLTNDELRDEVEKHKILFLRKLQDAPL